MAGEARTLVVTDRHVLWRNGAIVDHRERLLLRLQYVTDDEAKRILAALLFCGVLDEQWEDGR